MELTEKHLQAMKEVEEGATIYGYGHARLLREVQMHDASLIDIIDDISQLEKIVGRVFDGAKKIPYFGAILTPKGKKFIQKNTENKE